MHLGKYDLNTRLEVAVNWCRELLEKDPNAGPCFARFPLYLSRSLSQKITKPAPAAVTTASGYRMFQITCVDYFCHIFSTLRAAFHFVMLCWVQLRLAMHASHQRRHISRARERLYHSIHPMGDQCSSDTRALLVELKLRRHDWIKCVCYHHRHHHHHSCCCCCCYYYVR